MILIDKSIPEDCDYCFCNDDYYRCGLLNEEFPLHLSGRLPNCPLREMEKVDDTISRQAAIDAFTGVVFLEPAQSAKKYIDGVIERIQNLPSAQPNKEQIKTGQWEMFVLITSVYYGKQYYFKQENGIIYSRASYKYMSVDDAIKEFLDVIGE